MASACRSAALIWPSTALCAPWTTPSGRGCRGVRRPQLPGGRGASVPGSPPPGSGPCTSSPEPRIGYGRRHRSAQRDILLCIDQSGSMATSVVYAGIFGAVLASLAAVRTRMVVFDTSVVDLTDELHDPVELLFGTQLGGGTDINRALAYCHGLVRQPRETILVLISDLYEGGNRQEMLKRAAALASAGVQLIALLALNDDGAPSFDHSIAAALAGFGVLAFACTPDLFPDLMAAAINRQDIGQWAAGRDIVTARSGSG